MQFNAQQQRAVEFDGGHVLVLAGAGTGKTSTIVGRVVHLLEQGVDPRRILLLTFTRRAAREMRHRLGQQVGPTAKKVPAGTFHNFCLQYLRRWPDLFDCQGLSIIDRDDQLQLMKLARGTVIGKDARFPKAAELANYYSYARNTNRRLQEYLKRFTDHSEEIIQLIENVIDDYSKRKRDCRYFDYDDILYIFARQMHRRKSLREKIQKRYDHLLVDEMQDTNPLQWMILDAMRDPAKLFCVGDDAQSIYAFRGADFRNVHGFADRLPGASTLKLEENYRSTQEILDVANWLLDQSPLGYEKKLHAARGNGEKPIWLQVDDEQDEATTVVEDLLERRDGGANWRDHMILTRTAWAARTVEAGLIQEDIPYRFVGGTALMQSAHIKDLISLLRVADNRSDQLAWIRFLTLWPRVGEKTAASAILEVFKQPNTDAISERLQNRFGANPRLGEAYQQCVGLLDAPTKAIEVAIEKLEPLLEKKFDDWDRRSKDFTLLKKLARDHATVGEFLETYTLDPISESEASQEEQDDLVTLITVHSAKGTEAPVCYLIGVQPGNYPHSRNNGDEDQIEEERRVLYVAMTRAKDSMMITGKVRSHGAYTPYYNQKSLDSGTEIPFFLTDIPNALVESDCQYGATNEFGDELTEDDDDWSGPIMSFRD